MGLGALYGRTGWGEKSREEVTAATGMYREMGMDFWLKKAEEAMAETGWPPSPYFFAFAFGLVLRIFSKSRYSSA